MNLKDMSLLFTAGLVAMLIAIIRILSYILIEKQILLIMIAITCLSLFVKFALGIFV